MVNQENKTNRSDRWLFQLLGVLGVLLLGGSVAMLLSMRDVKVEKKKPEVIAPLVSIKEVHPTTQRMHIDGRGTVQAKHRMTIAPEVAGRIVSIHPNLIAGSRIASGEILFTIESDDYQLAIDQAEAAAQVQRAQLQQAEAHQAEMQVVLRDVALDLKRLMALRDQGAARDREVEKMTLQQDRVKTQLAAAAASIVQVKALLHQTAVAIRQAKLRLSKTKVVMPHDGVVINERLELGQFVGVGQSVIELYGDREFEVVVPLEIAEMAWLDQWPGRSSAKSDQLKKDAVVSSTAPLAEIYSVVGDRTNRWSGRLVRTHSQIDPRSRLISVVIEITQKTPDRAPGAQGPVGRLMPGQFVDVVVLGRTLSNVYQLPIEALRDQSTLWVVKDKKLAVRPVRVLRRDRRWFYVGDELSAGEQVVVTPLEIVIDGMAVRLTSDAVSDKKAGPTGHAEKPSENKGSGEGAK